MGIRDQAPIYGISNTVEAWAIVLGALGAVASLVYCAWAARKGRSPLPLYLFLGGGLTCFAEPFIDIAGGNIFAEVDVVPWNAALGRHIPMYIGLFLLFYLAPAYVVLLAMFERGGELSLRTYYATCAVLVGSTCVFEFLPLHFDLWQYYGSQPVKLGEFPIWWAFANSHGVVATALVAHVLLRLGLLAGAARALLVPLLPIVYLAAHALGAAPAYLTIGSGATGVLSVLGVLGAMVLCTLLFRFYGQIVQRLDDLPSPDQRRAMGLSGELTAPTIGSGGATSSIS